jgi:hypothetical protein
LQGLLNEITDRLTRQATLDDLERRLAGTPLRDGTDRDFQRQCCEFSLLRAAAAAIGIPGVDARREMEVQQELARRAKENGHPVSRGTSSRRSSVCRCRSDTSRLRCVAGSRSAT